MSALRDETIAAALKRAEKTCMPIEPVSKENPDFDLQDAYRIQLLNVEKEVASGRKITGKKIGLTSLAMQKMLGVDQPDFGHLLDSMEIKNNLANRQGLLQPKVEGEIAFVLKKDISGPHATVETVLEATDHVVAAIEIVDSRVANWKIGLIDTVADNASSGLYVLGHEKIDPSAIDLRQIKMTLFKNGAKVNEGIGTDVLGHPAYCVAWLANTLWQYGVTLRKGEVILSGALTAALDAAAGDDFRASFSELGEVTVRFE